MAKQILNIGSSANDGTGTSLRAGGDLINDNFNEIYTTFGNGTTLAAAVTIPHKIGGTNFTNSLLIGHSTTGTLNNAINNTGAGIAALDALTSGDYNTAIGDRAGTAITTGGANTVLGSNALAANISSNNNSAIGKNSLKLVTGADNIGLGYNSGANLTSGSGNVMIGNIAADSATGNKQLKIADGSSGSVVWIKGDSSGNLTTAGDVTLANNKKVIFGDAGENIVGNGTAMTIASSQNITLDAAGDITINADGSIISLQDGATEFLRLQHGGSNNSVIKNSNSDADILIKGSDGGSEITALTIDMSDAGSATFNNNVNVGGNATITGNLTVNGTTTTVNSTEVTIQNAFVFEGATADAHETTLTVVDPTADRTITLPNESGDVIIGKKGGTNFTNSLLIGHTTTGTLNAAQKNTGVGIAALDALTSGDDNTALGYQAGSAMTTNGGSVYIGSDAGKQTLGGSNTVVGANAFQSSNNANSYENTAIGSRALAGAGGSVTSLRNTALGRDSGFGITSGSYNVVLGYDSGDNISTGSGNVTIGTVDVASATGDRQLKIAGYDGTTTTTWISGDSSGVVTATLAANTITSTQLASATTLLILNSSGSTLKTIIGAGS